MTWARLVLVRDGASMSTRIRRYVPLRAEVVPMVGGFCVSTLTISHPTRRFFYRCSTYAAVSRSHQQVRRLSGRR